MPQTTSLMNINRADNFSDKFSKDSPLRKLIKIFRTNNVVRHHFQTQGNGRPAPQGVARAFFKNGINFNSTQVPGYSPYDRFARYSDYAEMESYPILAQALNIVADEVTQKNEDGKIIEIISEDNEIKSVLQDLMDNVLHLNGKACNKLVRNLCKYGDSFYLIDAVEDNGVINLIQMPANQVEREENFDPKNPGAVRYKWTAQNNVVLPNSFVAHFRLDGNDLFYPYGQSILEPARRPWRQLVLLEDAMMVYRITRAPERRVFFLDIQGTDSANIGQVIEQFNQSLKKHKVVNDKGQIDLRYGATMSMEEDYIIPVRGGDTATRIETLPGGQNIGDIEDIEFIRANLFASLGIPKAFLTFDQDAGSKATLTQEDIRFARTVARIQECVVNELVKICMIHLYLKGKRGKDLINFRIRMSNPSTVAELQKNELWRSRMDLVMSAGQGVFDTEFIYKNFLHLSDDTIDSIRKGQILDKIFQSKLIQLENSGGAVNPGDLGGLGGGMGMGGMGMGGGMGGLGGGMDLGGGMGGGMGSPMPMGGGPMESLGSKDLWRTSQKRSRKARGVDEIPGTDESEVFDSDPADISGLKRAVSTPLGPNESKKQTIMDEINQLLELRKQHGRKVKDELSRMTMREYGIQQPEVKADFSIISENILLQEYGDSGKSLKMILVEAREINEKVEKILESWEDKILE